MAAYALPNSSFLEKISLRAKIYFFVFLLIPRYLRYACPCRTKISLSKLRYLGIYLSNEGNHGPGSLSVFYVFVAEEADEKFLFACGVFFWLVMCLFIRVSLK